MTPWLATIAILAGSIAGAQAQVFPARPITMIVPFPAGGPLDTGARVMAEHMRGSLGQPVIVENIAGASGSIGVGRVARAAPDDYTLVVGGTPTHVMTPPVMKLPYDVVADFQPIADHKRSEPDRRQEGHAGERPEGIDRVA